MVEKIKEEENIKQERVGFLLSEAILLTIISVSLFLMGYFYDQGWLEAFGINGQFFPKDFQTHLTGAVYVLILSIVEVVTEGWRGTIFMLFFFVIIFILPFSGMVRNVIKSFSPMLIVLGVFFVFLTYGIGQNQTRKVQKLYKGCDIKKPAKGYACIFMLKDKKVFASGLFIAKSESYIALWDGSNPRLYPLNNGEELMIQRAQK